MTGGRPPGGPAVAGDVIGPSRAERFRASERRILAVSRVLDDLVTGPGGRRFGLDPIIGLIPVVGDGVAAVFGGWIIAEAARFRIPPVVLARMTLNLVVDLAIGAIPFVGDVFDFFYKSNDRNLTLYRRYALEPEASTTEHRLFFAGLLLVLVGLIWLVLRAVVWLIEQVVQLVRT
jgi:hypothetical protein